MLWEPTEKQWWVTGFNPSYFGNVDASKQVMICSVDFSGNEEMYTELVKSMSTTDSSNINDFLMFDGDNYIAWIIWHERNLAK